MHGILQVNALLIRCAVLLYTMARHTGTKFRLVVHVPASSELHSTQRMAKYSVLMLSSLTAAHTATNVCYTLTPIIRRLSIVFMP